MSGFISAWSDIGNTYWQSHFHKLTFLQKSKRKTRNWHLNQLGNSLSGKWDILLSISYCALSDVPCRQFSCMERHNKHFHYRIIMIKCKEQYHVWYNAFFVQRITYVCFETEYIQCFYIFVTLAKLNNKVQGNVTRLETIFNVKSFFILVFSKI